WLAGASFMLVFPKNDRVGVGYDGGPPLTPRVLLSPTGWGLFALAVLPFGRGLGSPGVAARGRPPRGRRPRPRGARARPGGGAAAAGGGMGAPCRVLAGAYAVCAPGMRARSRRRRVCRGRGVGARHRRRHALSPRAGALQCGQPRPRPAVVPRSHPARAALRHGDSLELLLLDHLLPHERLEELRAAFRAASRALAGGAVGGRIDVPSGAVPRAPGQAGRGPRRVARDAGALPRHALGEVRRRASRRSQTVTPFTVGIPVYNEEAILVPNTERL